MVYFDFGEKVETKTIYGNIIHEGESILSIWNCYWEVVNNSKTSFNSDTINDEYIKQMIQVFQGSSLLEINLLRDDGDARLLFSNGAYINLDITNLYAELSTDSVMHLAVSGQETIGMLPGGEFFILQDHGTRTTG